MQIMDLIIKLSPIGVACLICPVVAANGPAVLGKLAMVLAGGLCRLYCARRYWFTPPPLLAAGQGFSLAVLQGHGCLP